MEKQHLGSDPQTKKPVWVIWFDGGVLLEHVMKLVPFPCPQCGSIMELTRARGVIDVVAETPNCNSVSERCRPCQTQVHFDTTISTERQHLRWPKVAVGTAGVHRPKEQALPATVVEHLEKEFARRRTV